MSSLPSERLLAGNDDFDPFTADGWDVIRSVFLATDPPRGRVLDVGCGTGSSAVVYASVASELIGLDHSHKMLTRAHARFPEHRWLQGDAMCLPFADGTFDVIAFSSVLHHLHDPLAAAREALRVLRRGGLAFAFDPHLLHPAFALFRHPSSPCYTSEGVDPQERPVLGTRISDTFRRAGFENVRHRSRSGISYQRVAPARLDRSLRLFNRLDALLQRSGLGRWFGSFVFTVGHKTA